jgi:hypothetical protein
MLALIFCAPGHAQDSPSLADLARQAQKNKANAPVKKVFTNDDLSSGSSTAAGFGSSSPDAPRSAEQSIRRLEALIDKIDSLDRDTLVKNALQGVDRDFPGRSAWEQRLFAAKQSYVARGRDLLQDAKQILATAETLKAVQDRNDPRVKDLTYRLQNLVRDGTHLDAAFQAVVLEGRDLAGQALGH